jgi:hypothetical protein
VTEFLAALRTAGLIPAGLPAEIEIAIANIAAQTVEAVISKHIADPEFAARVDAWNSQFEASKGDPIARQKAAAALSALIGE